MDPYKLIQSTGDRASTTHAHNTVTLTLTLTLATVESSENLKELVV
jgi:hypothetical protein